MRIVKRVEKGGLLCSDGVERTVQQIADIVGISRSGVQSRITLHGLTSDLVCKMADKSLIFGHGVPDEIVGRKKEGPFIILQGSDGLWYRLGELADEIGIDRKLIDKRIKRAGFPVKTLVLCRRSQRKSGPSLPRLAEAGMVNGFNRTDFCHRETGECRKYSSCLDAMCRDSKWKWSGLECYKAQAKKEATYRAIRADI